MKQEIIELNDIAKQGKLLCINFDTKTIDKIDEVVDSINLTAIGPELMAWPPVKCLYSTHLLFINQYMFVVNDNLGIHAYAKNAGRAMLSGKRLEVANTLLTDIGML